MAGRRRARHRTRKPRYAQAHTQTLRGRRGYETASVNRRRQDLGLGGVWKKRKEDLENGGGLWTEGRGLERIPVFEELLKEPKN